MSDIAQRSRAIARAWRALARGFCGSEATESLRLIDACSRTVLDFVAAFVDPATLPSVAASWRELELRAISLTRTRRRTP
jgi:hypothetical protein